ncbi:MAG: hypothetical protein H5T59_13280, partial [Anaerolineae bacterium]|nr:hypothetical protein [Anaerolineae bacterium]
DDLLAGLRSEGWAEGTPDDVARFSLTFHLREGGYRDLGGGRWTSAEILHAVERQVVHRPKVPLIRSKVAQILGEDDTPDFALYEEVDLEEEEARAALEEAGEEREPPRPSPPQTLDEWRRKAPSGPIRLPPLTYQHIREAFFPVTKDLAPAFPPGDDPLLVHITIVEGDPLRCLVSRERQVITAINVREFADRFLSRGIPAGTYLWLERIGDYEYRVFPRPLPEPRQVRCKLLSLQEGRLVVEEAEIPMRYEGDPHLFKAELRFEDLEALFREAEELGWSIFDALWYTFPALARLEDPEEKVHWKDLFHAVFFRCRMCSPRSVLTELYTRACFVPVGGGYFRFEPEQGVKRGSTLGPSQVRPGRGIGQQTRAEFAEPDVTVLPGDEETIVDSPPTEERKPQPRPELGEPRPRKILLPGTEPPAPLLDWMTGESPGAVQEAPAEHPEEPPGPRVPPE